MFCPCIVHVQKNYNLLWIFISTWFNREESTITFCFCDNNNSRGFFCLAIKPAYVAIYSTQNSEKPNLQHGKVQLRIPSWKHRQKQTDFLSQEFECEKNVFLFDT